MKLNLQARWVSDNFWARKTVVSVINKRVFHLLVLLYMMVFCTSNLKLNTDSSENCDITTEPYTSYLPAVLQTVL